VSKFPFPNCQNFSFKTDKKSTGNPEQLTCISSDPVIIQFFLGKNRAHLTGKSQTYKRKTIDQINETNKQETADEIPRNP
jgi:hypothetical protein